MAPKLTRVVRLDSLPLNQTYFTAEGYLVDRPILTSTGIFEYTNPDGSVRRSRKRFLSPKASSPIRENRSS